MTQSNILRSQPSLSINRKGGELGKIPKDWEVGFGANVDWKPQTRKQSGKQPLENQNEDFRVQDFLNPYKKITSERKEEVQHENMVLAENQLKQPQTLLKSKSADIVGDYGSSKDDVEETIRTMNENNKESIVEEDEKKLNELLRAITHYKILTQEIEKHLKDPKMVLCNLKEKYVEYYVSKYDEIIKEKEQFVGRDDLYGNVIDAAFEDLKEFIEIFHQAIYHFYKIQYLDQRIQIEKSFFKVFEFLLKFY